MRGSSVVECLTRVRGAAGWSLTGVTALCPWARQVNPSLVLVQPRKTCPFITERLLMGRKESNQTNKTQFRPDKMSGLSWIQMVWHSQMVLKKFSRWQKHKELPDMQRVKQASTNCQVNLKLNVGDWTHAICGISHMLSCCCIGQLYCNSETCLKGPLKIRQNKNLNGKW